MYRLWLDYDYSVSEKLRLRLDYDYFLNKIHDYDYSLFVIDYNRFRLRDYDYLKSDLNHEIRICSNDTPIYKNMNHKWWKARKKAIF